MDVKKTNIINISFLIVLVMLILGVGGLQVFTLIHVKDVQNKTLEVAEIKNEIQQLRHTVQSKMSQELIYLKVLILNHRVDPALAKEIAEAIHLYSRQFNKDPDLILAIIKQESNFNTLAKSTASAFGLMQIFPSWKKTACTDLDLADPADNINCGIKIYSFYEEAYKDTMLSLTVYNRGPNPVDHDLAKDRDPINEYAGKVMATYNKLKIIGEEEGHLINETF